MCIKYMSFGSAFAITQIFAFSLFINQICM
jgi:hypothetical protein